MESQVFAAWVSDQDLVSALDLALALVSALDLASALVSVSDPVLVLDLDPVPVLDSVHQKQPLHAGLNLPDSLDWYIHTR